MHFTRLEIDVRTVLDSKKKLQHSFQSWPTQRRTKQEFISTWRIAANRKVTWKSQPSMTWIPFSLFHSSSIGMQIRKPKANISTNEDVSSKFIENRVEESKPRWATLHSPGELFELAGLRHCPTNWEFGKNLSLSLSSTWEEEIERRGPASMSRKCNYSQYIPTPNQFHGICVSCCPVLRRCVAVRIYDRNSQILPSQSVEIINGIAVKIYWLNGLCHSQDTLLL